jgi:hypothetical protein
MGGKRVSDGFLYETAPMVRPKFADELYSRLTRGSLRPLAWTRAAGTRTMLGYFLAVVAALAIGAACARELTRPRYVQIDGMWVLEGIPSTYTWEVRVPARTESGGEVAVGRAPQRVSLEEAISLLPYPMGLPHWLPEGFFLLDEDVLPPRYPDWLLSVIWESGDGEGLVLWASPAYNAEMRVPRGMWEQRSVRGTPAVLVRGRFPLQPDMSLIGRPVDLPLPTPGPEPVTLEIEHQWDENAGLGLTWQTGSATFHLQTYGDYLTVDELIRIAESIGP